MTAKEKAKELFEAYLNVGMGDGWAKDSGVIAINEILKLVDDTMQGWLDADIIAYWKEVKQEIQKL
jgi:hypothetical protein